MKHLRIAPLAFLIGNAFAAPPLPPSTVTIELGKGQTAKVTRRAGDTSPTVMITVNKGATVKVMEYVEMHGGLNADISGVLPSAFDAGSSELRTRPTTEQPIPGDAAFRIVCGLVAFAWNDPVVYPGQKGRSHLHSFFGNTGTDENSTAASIANSGNSSCRGGIANRSAYWVPTMLDLRTNRPVPVGTFIAYYKGGEFAAINGYGWAGTDAVWHQVTIADPVTGQQVSKFPGFSPLPAGLRMIAGDPNATAPRASGAPRTFRWKCSGGPNKQNTPGGDAIENCDVGADLLQEVFFPQCWDGKNLDSPDHKSHMSYSVQLPNKGDPRGWFHRECPTTHPVVLPLITLNVSYRVTEKDEPMNWRLSCDQNGLAKPGGYCSHGDWFNGWKKDASDAWLNGCIVAGKDCHAHLLGDGRQIF